MQRKAETYWYVFPPRSGHYCFDRGAFSEHMRLKGHNKNRGIQIGKQQVNSCWCSAPLCRPVDTLVEVCSGTLN